jgi:hypothetical protein
MGNCVRREVGLDFDNQPGSIDKMRERIVNYNIFLIPHQISTFLDENEGQD